PSLRGAMMAMPPAPVQGLLCIRFPWKRSVQPLCGMAEALPGGAMSGACPSRRRLGFLPNRGWLGCHIATSWPLTPRYFPHCPANPPDTLGPGDSGPIEVPAISDLVRGEVVRDEDTVAGDGRASVADADRGAPEDFRPLRWEASDDAGFGPDGIAVRPHPLRPVVGGGGRGKHPGQEQGSARRHLGVSVGREGGKQRRRRDSVQESSDLTLREDQGKSPKKKKEPFTGRREQA